MRYKVDRGVGAEVAVWGGGSVCVQGGGGACHWFLGEGLPRLWGGGGGEGWDRPQASQLFLWLLGK